LEKLLANWPTERKLLFCDEAGDAPTIAEALKSSRNEPWAILTGPEGGFDPKERETIRAVLSVVPVTLGQRILRADTAALAALAVWQTLVGDWR
jgi:16S rRNA (uracil1498-N3)-methyltransferase